MGFVNIGRLEIDEDRDGKVTVEGNEVNLNITANGYFHPLDLEIIFSQIHQDTHQGVIGYETYEAILDPTVPSNQGGSVHCNVLIGITEIEINPNGSPGAATVSGRLIQKNYLAAVSCPPKNYPGGVPLPLPTP